MILNLALSSSQIDHAAAPRNMINIFRILGDFSHLASIGILIHTVATTIAIDGISLKTQVLYCLVFLTRYMDLLTLHWVSFYNTLMKLFFIGSSVYIVVLIQSFQKKNPIAYKEMVMNDTFNIKVLLGGALFMSLILHHKFTVLELMWSFSVWLECVAILPQLFMLSKSGKAQSLTIHYIFALGVYRFLYIFNWIWRYYSEGKWDRIAVLAGIIQTLLYSDFFYIYYRKVIRGGPFELPH